MLYYKMQDIYHGTSFCRDLDRQAPPSFSVQILTKKVIAPVSPLFVLIWTKTQLLKRNSNLGCANVLKSLQLQSTISAKLRKQDLWAVFHIFEPVNLANHGSKVLEKASKACILKTKPCRANLRPFLTPFSKPHTLHQQHYWLDQTQFGGY